jgi:G3E family GTPase
MTKRVPTNIITGFLGTGKTTAIMSLLKRKPDNESWAVLVNEFGEIGIDGAILSDHGALIKEVPGGCMCCTVGVPMSVGINALLRQKPDRLIIEPTGLGHPKQVIATLTSPQYAPYVDLKATIAMVDPRYLSDERYTQNQNFNDQLATADIIVGNKVDACSQTDISVFNEWIVAQNRPTLQSELSTHGEFSASLLELDRASDSASNQVEAHHHEHAAMEPQFELAPGEKFIRKENRGQGFYSCGWLFGAEVIFDFDGMFSMLTSLTAERVKGVLNTDKGCYSYNVANGVVSVNELTLSGFESRIEVIDASLLPWDDLESVLLTLSDL